MDDNVIGPVGGVIAGIIITAGIMVNADSLFPEAYEELIELEGGYVNNPSDRGGETMWGITEPVARKCGYRGAMKDMKIEVAAECSWMYYWKPLSAENFSTQSDTAYKDFVLSLFHIGYHAGSRSATRWFQTCLNELNRNERDYKDIRVDGKIGRKTVQAFQAFRAKRGDDGSSVLSSCIKVGYGGRFRSLIQRDKRQEEFAYGWYKRLAK